MPAGSKSGGDIRRNLATYVQSLKNATLTPATAQQAIGDAIVVGIQIGQGTGNGNMTSVVTELDIKTGAYDWNWYFSG